MGALQNYICVLPRSQPNVAHTLRALGPIVVELLGLLRTVSVQDFVKGKINDKTILGNLTAALPEFSDQQLVFYYPSERSKGVLMLSHAGHYDLVSISLTERHETIELLTRIWCAVGERAVAVLAGEELEANERHIEELVNRGKIPSDLDLCQAAMIRTESSMPDDATDVAHGGRLLVRSTAS